MASRFPDEPTRRRGAQADWVRADPRKDGGTIQESSDREMTEVTWRCVSAARDG